MSQVLLKNESRESLIVSFLKKQGLGEARTETIPGDASYRNYRRLFDQGKSYILMDAPPPKEDVRPFINVQEFLVKNGFSAPKIFAADIEEGLILLEDLGDNLYGRILNGSHSSSLEKQLYKNAVDVLSELHKKPAADLPAYDNSVLFRESSLFTDWYLPKIVHIDLSEKQLLEYQAILSTLFSHLTKANGVVVLRDYHANNLIALPNRKAHKNVGLLDFQDALIGHPAYDLVSLLEDARRDVPISIIEETYSYFLKNNPHLDSDDFKLCYSILGAQRNLKIIGIFSRLWIRDGKKQYLGFLPRVWDYLERDLEHPQLRDLKNWLDKVVPRQTRENHA